MGLIVVYGVIAIFVFILFWGTISVLDDTFNTKAASARIRPMIIASAIWPITLYQIFKKR